MIGGGLDDQPGLVVIQRLELAVSAQHHVAGDIGLLPLTEIVHQGGRVE